MVRIGLYYRWMKTPLLLCLKGLLSPFCFCSKRYLIPFCRMLKGIRYRLQNPKKSAKIKVYCMQCSITLWQFAKRAQITFGAVAKGILLPFWLLCMRNPRIACNADHVLPYRWENKSRIKNGGEILKFCNYPRFLYSTRPIQPYHFQADQIWCDGTFNYRDTKAKCRHLKNWPVKGLCGRCLSEYIDWIFNQSCWNFRNSFLPR
jgi:hypothetical protein